VTRKCWTPNCDRGAVEGVRTEGVIAQSDGARAGTVYACECQWKRIDPIPSEMKSNGWTASRSPCGPDDVDAR